MEKWRQKFHLEPPAGWLNDPNGLSFFKSKYHVFFQYRPDSAYGKGRTCWGHYESRDLVNWEFTGTVFYPDIPEDRSGVYSGSAVVNGDTLEIFYTGNVKHEGNFDYTTAGRDANVIHVSTKDCRNFSKKEILMTNADYPKNCSCHVRDPKVFKTDDGWEMVLGARTLDNVGEVLLYKSSDLKKWIFEKTISIDNFGYMWECPDMFEIGGNRFLSISPQGLKHEEYKYQNVYSAGYFKFNDDTPYDFEEWDSGFDFYAPQTFIDGKGRRLLIGWMGIGDIPYTNPTAELGFQHCLTLIREIKLSSDGQLLQYPTDEFNSLRNGFQEFESGKVKDISLPFDLEADVKGDFKISLNMLDITYKNCIFKINFRDEKLGSGRTHRQLKISGLKKIRIIADMSSLEIYLNDGEKVMSTRFYPNENTVKISLENITAKIFKLKETEVIINGK